ncbi:uncharacterized protein LOC110859679 isoform X1 [Folsomia candida]|uniref:uncharacterized protein LOC110859679 isoform X1 n=1 Tax=Folsomia candida TaxID=158441 RepID=UPI000B8FDF1B|nr:uncharacterized protein LOC110859679 isoform X1 [Folsomia candida]XP_035715577.1 uncharacterized protein LOC110859679 isoform X1 [Folsomia candida]XP_035715578.1 uncharacterized protein LOC110859679 isoform X1 [Folsomia candida]XP_035715579.1 uncharacterized protein LOC110859679 isoform X1 [Folsomia candida]
MLAVSFALMTLFLAQVTHAAMIEDGKHYWNETLQGQSDGHLLQGRYLIYPIPAINTNGWDFSMMSIVYDTELRTTVSSTGLYNSENAAGRTRPPTSSWRLYFNEVDCKYPSAPYPTGYDRGHLIPSCYWRWTETVRLGTFFCANQAPQNPTFNRGWWSHTVEVELAALAKQRNGFIMTGVSEATLDTVSGHRIPLYFWKLVCTWNPTTGQAEVYGYYGSNAAAGERVCASQNTIAREAMGENYFRVLRNAWEFADADLRDNRNINGVLPTGVECADALELPAGRCLVPYSEVDQCGEDCCLDDEA